jgi:aldose 1-epimerase
MKLRHITVTLLGLALLELAGCSSTRTATSDVERRSFGKMPDGAPIYEFTLKNKNGAEARIINYGGIVTSFKVPDRKGRMADVVLGYDNLDGYLKSSAYFGCLVGRYGNRIGGARFTLNGKEHTLATNNPPNSLHGGWKGFDKVVWTPKVMATSEGVVLELSYLSKDGEEGYPGNLEVKASYSLGNDNGLKLVYTATTDSETVVNLTQHSYFNLKGAGDILGHVVMLNADKFTPVDETLIPTGEMKPVEGTPFDFRKPTAIGARINKDDEQLKFGKGYDHNWMLNKKPGELALAARVVEPETGLTLEVLTTEPGLQFYTGNFLDGKITGKGGWNYKHRNAFCMEPQHFPDSPNKPGFPSVVLKPGEMCQSTIIFRVKNQ